MTLRTRYEAPSRDRIIMKDWAQEYPGLKKAEFIQAMLDKGFDDYGLINSTRKWKITVAQIEKVRRQSTLPKWY